MYLNLFPGNLFVYLKGIFSRTVLNACIIIYIKLLHFIKMSLNIIRHYRAVTNHMKSVLTKTISQEEDLQIKTESAEVALDAFTQAEI